MPTVIAQEIGDVSRCRLVRKIAPLDNLMLFVYGSARQTRLGCYEEDDYECIANILDAIKTTGKKTKKDLKNVRNQVNKPWRKVTEDGSAKTKD